MPVDCEWGPWEFNKCSVTCGGGTKTGVRRVVTQAEDDGKDCTGPSIKEEACNTDACPVGKKCTKEADMIPQRCSQRC